MVAATTGPGAAVAESWAESSRATSYTDAELTGRIAEIERVIRQARMEQLELIAEADRRRLFAEQSARSTQAWLQNLLRIDSREAKARLQVAADVTTSPDAHDGSTTELPATAQTLSEGVLGLEHATIIRRCVRALPESAKQRAGEVEALLAANARRMCPRDLAKLAERITYTLDKDGALQEERAQHEARELHYATARDGMLVIKARLDRETGAKFVAALRPLAAPRPETDGEKDPRTVGQRNADGFAAMVDLVLDSDQMPRTGGQRPHLTVTIDFDDLKQRLTNGTPGTLTATEQSITAENVRRIACDCEVLPMVLNGDSLPLDVGTTQRTAPTHIRAALLQRDGVCAFPDCDRPPGTPQAHHIKHWIDGGPTELNNMVMLCPHHHRRIHDQHWTITLHQGRPMFTPPSSVDKSRKPKPGGKARPAAYRETLQGLIPTPRTPEGTP
ncbi:HNH endonuclease signature motif containing protein [Saccharopolyspora antimicrobica]